MDGDPARGVIIGDQRVRLHACVALTAGDEPVLEHVVGLGEPGVDVAGGDPVVGHDVAFDPRVDGRRVLGHGLLRILHHGQELVVDLDGFDASERGLLVDGDDRGHSFPGVADHVVGQRCLVLDERAVLGLGHVLLDVDGEHPGHGVGARGVDLEDPGVGVRAAQDLAVDHPRQPHVVRVLRLARHLLQGVGARQRLADHVVGRRPVVPFHGLAGRDHDRVDDLGVARAAAQVAAQVLADILLGWVRVLGQQGLGGHHHAGRAVAALDPEALGERPLHGIEFAVATQALDGDHLAAGGLHREHQARVRHLPVDEHGARRALALVAGPLGSGEPEVVADRVHQGAVRLDQQVVADAVHVELDRYLGHASPLPSRPHGPP